MADAKLPESQLEDAIKSGAYQFPKGSRVNVVGPDGQTVSVPGEQAAAALDQGYKYETQFDGAVRKEAGKYSGLGTSLAVFAGQAADEFGMGLPELAADKLADPFKVAVKDRIKKDHDVANTTGGLVGFGGSMFYGGPLFKLAGAASKAGNVAEKIVASNLAKVGVERGAESLAKNVLARTAENSAKYGVEGLVSAAPYAAGEGLLESVDAINENRIPNYQAAAESLMMGGGLGLGFGIVTGPTGALLQKLERGVQKRAAAIQESVLQDPTAVLKNSYKEAGVPTAPNPERQPLTDSLLESAEIEGANGSVLEKLKEEAGKLKPNAQEISDAGKRMGVPILDEMLSGSKIIQDLGSAISKKATFSGIKRAQLYNQVHDGMEETAKLVFNSTDLGVTRFETGTRAVKQIASRAEESLNKQAEIYKALRMGYEEIPIEMNTGVRIASNIKKELPKVFDGSAKSTINNIADFLEGGGVTNMNELKELKTRLRNLHGPNREQNMAVNDVMDRLTDLEKRSIKKQIDLRIDEAKGRLTEGGADEIVRLQGLYDDMQKADKNWAEFAQGLGDAGDELGLGNIKNPRDFLDKIQDVPAEKIVGKLLPKNDIARMRKLEARFPEEVATIKNLEKAKLLDAAHDSATNKFSAQRLMAKYNNLEREVQEALFTPAQRAALKDIDTIKSAIPANINPSGTAQTLSYMGAFKPTNLLDSVTDFGASEVIRKTVNVEGVIGVERQMGTVSKAIDAILDTGIKAGGAMAPKNSVSRSIIAFSQYANNDRADRKADFQAMQKKLGEVVADPISATDYIAEQLRPLESAGAPRVAEAMAAKIVEGMAYLYRTMPKTTQPHNPFNPVPFQPSDRDLAAFERKVSVVSDPMVALMAFKDGTLTKDHVEALGTIYPQIYGTIRQRILDRASTGDQSMPFASRINLSLLLGLTLDSAVSQSSIRSFQDAFLGAGAQAAQAPEPGLSQAGLAKITAKDSHETPAQRMQRERPI